MLDKQAKTLREDTSIDNEEFRLYDDEYKTLIYHFDINEYGELKELCDEARCCYPSYQLFKKIVGAEK